MSRHHLLALAALYGACSVALAADLPVRKPGLWEITLTLSSSRLPPRVEKVCLDKATDQLLYKVGAGASEKMCSKVDIHGAGATVEVDSQCKLGETNVTSHSVTRMTGDTAYHTDIRIHYDPAMFGKTDATSTDDAKWLGACPADMKPGDIVVATSPGMPMPLKMNLVEMFKGGQ